MFLLSFSDYFPCSFRNMGYNADCSNLMITWSQFCKEPLPDRSFTFWEWFYAVMKLTKEDLRGMWIDGSVQMCLHENIMKALDPKATLIKPCYFTSKTPQRFPLRTGSAIPEVRYNDVLLGPALFW